MSAKVHKHFIEPKDCQAAQANDKLLHDSHSSRSARRRIGHAHDPGRERNIRTKENLRPRRILASNESFFALHEKLYV